MKFDVAVVGGGLVGAALARALRGMSVALVAQERSAGAQPAAPLDARVYAISPGNAAFLSQLKAWQRIPEARLAPVYAMRVYGDDGQSRIDFDAYRAGTSELAWIVEDSQLQAALWEGLAAQDHLALFAPAECRAMEITEDRASLVLASGERIDAQLVAGADGARSFVRAAAGISAEERGYGQTAVVANFACERPHRNVALQWFQGGPVLALLPLPGERVSMVWSTREAEAARLLALGGAALAEAVGEASRHALGALSLVTPARGFPLRRLLAARIVARRVALAGDAAHVVHPLAGQGANLGLHDARDLSLAIAERGPLRGAGDARVLRRYERARAEDILAMRATVHGLFGLFGAQSACIGKLRNAGLKATDHLPMLKNVLIRHAMS